MVPLNAKTEKSLSPEEDLVMANGWSVTV